MASTWPASNDSLATNRTDATTMATTHADDHNNANDAINKIERSRMGQWTPRDHQPNLRAWTADPWAAVSGGQPGAGSLVVSRILFPEDFTIANAYYFASRQGSGAQLPVNVYVAVYNSSGTRIGVSAAQDTPVLTSGAKTAAITVDGGQSLAVTAGSYGYVGFLIGTQSTTAVQLAGIGTPTNTIWSPIGGASAAQYRAGFTGASLTAAPASFTPSSLTAYWAPWFALGV